VRITEQSPPDSFRLEVEGSGRIGFVKGGGLLKIAAKDAGSEVTYDGDVQVGGTIAAIGQRLIDSTSKMMIKKFFEKLAEEAA
jgi:carbon monoxide dehydrogenase subunit G